MLRHWLNEMMNLLAGNSRYVHYGPASQLLFVALLVLFIVFSILVMGYAQRNGLTSA